GHPTANRSQSDRRRRGRHTRGLSRQRIERQPDPRREPGIERPGVTGEFDYVQNQSETNGQSGSETTGASAGGSESNIESNHEDLDETSHQLVSWDGTSSLDYTVRRTLSDDRTVKAAATLSGPPPATAGGQNVTIAPGPYLKAATRPTRRRRFRRGRAVR